MLAKFIFYAALVIDAIGLCVAAYFMIGDAFKPYSGTNNPSMYALVLAVIGIMVAGWLLRSKGYAAIGTILVCIPATPLFFYGLFILAFLIIKPNMR
jgi:hypothetical protein